MTTLIDLDYEATQTALAELVGVTQPTISNLMTDGKIPATGTLGELLRAYCARLRDQAAGRMGDEVGGLDLCKSAQPWPVSSAKARPSRTPWRGASTRPSVCWLMCWAVQAAPWWIASTSWRVR